MSERVSERDLAGALEPYIVDVQETGKEIGSGAYAIVVEVDYFGTACVGKKLHRILHEQGIGDLVQCFKEECRLLSQLRHPHVVQFIGVYFEPGSNVPALVMEQLSTTLARHLANYGVPREDVAFSILCDTALALRYLHGHKPPIIHRDLPANNVLLTDGLRAKVSDLGVARILNLTPLQLRNLTQAPGSPPYMPPEALVANPIYTTSIDAFSFGILMIHTFSGRWPLPTETAVVPSSGIWLGTTEQAEVRALSEADRRQTYLGQIGHNHSSMSLIRECISNNPHCRPEAPEIHERVRGMLADCRRHARDDFPLNSTSVMSDDDLDLVKESEITRLQTQLMQLEADNTNLQAVLHHKDGELHLKAVEFDAHLKTLQHQKDTEIELLRTSKEHEAKTLKLQYSAKLRAKEEETATLQSSLESLLASREKLLASKDDTLTQYKSNIQALNDQIIRLQETISNRSQVSLGYSLCKRANGCTYMHSSIDQWIAVLALEPLALRVAK